MCPKSYSILSQVVYSLDVIYDKTCATEISDHPSLFLRALSLLETIGKIFTLNSEHLDLKPGLDALWLWLFRRLWHELMRTQGFLDVSNSVCFVFLLRSLPKFAKMLDARNHLCHQNLLVLEPSIRQQHIAFDLSVVIVFYKSLSFHVALHLSPGLALDILTSQPAWSIFEICTILTPLSNDAAYTTNCLLWGNLVMDTLFSIYAKLPSVFISRQFQCNNESMFDDGIINFLPQLAKSHINNNEKLDCFSSSLRDAICALSSGPSYAPSKGKLSICVSSSSTYTQYSYFFIYVCFSSTYTCP